jgi:benzaldehyde dehydrogenase (NAD)
MNNVLSPEVWAGKLYSGGWREPGLGTVEVVDEASGAGIGAIGVASARDVAAAAAAAHRAQAAWVRVPGPRRGDVLREFSRLLLAHGDEISGQIMREAGPCEGGPIGFEAHCEVQMTAWEIVEAAALGSAPAGIPAATAEMGRHSVAGWVPIGVVGIITPCNSPLWLSARAVGPVLATGNAVLLKPDPQTPVSGGVLFAQLFEQAGLPEGLLHVLPGGIPTAEAIVADPSVDMISFTGSTRPERLMSPGAGGRLKGVSLSAAATTLTSSGATSTSTAPRRSGRGIRSSTRDRSA